MADGPSGKEIAKMLGRIKVLIYNAHECPVCEAFSLGLGRKSRGPRVSMDDAKSSQSRSWRASAQIHSFTAILGLFTENFLYGSIVPLLPYMLEERIGMHSSQTQRLTAQVLMLPGLVALPTAPAIGHFADKTGSRKGLLLLMLAICATGVSLAAAASSIWTVYAGRILQSIASTGMWILGFAMLTEAMGPVNTGRSLGWASAVITAGVIMGPAVSGVALQCLGYWSAWSIGWTLLALCLIARLLIVDREVTPESRTVDDERAPLQEPEPASERQSKCKQRTVGFCRVMAAQPAVYASMCNIMASAIILSGFDTILPLYLRNTFGWKSGSIGSIFLALQVPNMCMAPLVGWLRDLHGIRWPTAAGWCTLAPLLVMTGWQRTPHALATGEHGFSGEERKLVTCIVGIGLTSTLFRGAGILQLTTLTTRMSKSTPGIFGNEIVTSRVFTLTEVSFNLGLILGPSICGSLADTHGFQYTCCALAFISLSAGMISLSFMT